MATSFHNYWDMIQVRLSRGQSIKSWSVAGRSHSTFGIVRVEPECITVAPQNGKARKVPKREFERVFQVWSAYKAGKQRHELGFTQHSTYIITLLHWVESL